MVAGELTTRSSISFMVDCSNVSSRGLLEADVAMANAAAAVDVLLLVIDIQLHHEHNRRSNRNEMFKRAEHSKRVTNKIESELNMLAI